MCGDGGRWREGGGGKKKNGTNKKWEPTVYEILRKLLRLTKVRFKKKKIWSELSIRAGWLGLAGAQ